MNAQNFEFLKNGLKYLGFDEKLGIELAKQLKEQPNEFQLRTQNHFGKDGSDHLRSTLNFKKGSESDMYFFNNYTAILKKGDEERQQTFYIQKNHGITAKEAYNLLQGHSVNKDLVNKEQEKYNAWIKLDFDKTDKNGNYLVKQYHSNYGYDLEKSLAAHPIKELADPDQKDKLLKSLEKGNIQSVIFVKDGGEEKMFVGANPQFKMVDVYDGNMKAVRQDNIKEQTQGKEASASVGESQKKVSAKAGAKQSANKPNVKSLLPKKNAGTKKGMKIG